MSSDSSSAFLRNAGLSASGSLGILHLRRDQLVPVLLSEHDEADEGYEEGKVINTRYGSFPHSTLINVPWGSQVRASKVDTGSRGRKSGGEKKRKRDEAGQTPELSTPKAAVVAQSGFAHLLPPTPELWTMSLPHRTQVVYTPDYSLVLQKLKARPGVQIIEAGAGSGSFSHAAARAVFNGYPTETGRHKGRVWSFEFHEQRVEKLRQEISDHDLKGIVEVTHRDVYENGFGVMDEHNQQQVQASAVFLDLPSPWLALPHLIRGRGSSKISGNESQPEKSEATSDLSKSEEVHVELANATGPLSCTLPVHICCFLPCIEQVQRTVTSLQSHGWQHVSVIEVAAQRFEIRRERVGINEEGLRGVNASPANVGEAIRKQREDESRTQIFHQITQKHIRGEKNEPVDRHGVRTKVERLKEIQEASEQRKLYKEGRLVHRSEPELKTHTSYLVFAILPRIWTEEDERRERERWLYSTNANGTRAQARDGMLPQ